MGAPKVNQFICRTTAYNFGNHSSSNGHAAFVTYPEADPQEINQYLWINSINARKTTRIFTKNGIRLDP